MLLSLKRFSITLGFQCLFLFIDLIINSFSYLAKGDEYLIIFLFIIQDACLILSSILLISSICSTYVYQAGLISLLYNKFCWVLLCSIIYFILSISHHIWITSSLIRTPLLLQWPTALSALFIVHRLYSPLYYYMYKRSALKMSDPRFYENSDWLSEQIAIKR